MAPQTFVELTGMNGWDNGSVLIPTAAGCTSGDYVTEYSNKAVWNPIVRRFQFVGSPHGNCGSTKLVIYDDATNTWSAGPQPLSFQQPSHTYDQNSIDPATGTHYFRYFGTTRFFSLASGASSWTEFAGATQPGTFTCCDAVEWFPEMNRLLWWDAQAGLWAWNPSNQQWSGLANSCISNNVAGLTNLAAACNLSYFAEYSPIAQAVLIGDGGGKLFKVSASGAISPLGTPPIPTGVAQGGGGTGAQVTVDPVTGHYLFISNSAMYEYDLTADAWTLLNIPTRPAFFTVGGVMESLIGAPISSYGVILYVKADDSSTARVWLYKHAR